MQYEFMTPVAGTTAQAAGEELARIEAEHGSLSPSLVVDESRDESAVLHPVFDWNDKTAAEKYRRVQAGNLIRAVVVQVEEAPSAGPVRAFVNINAAGYAREGQYINVHDMLSDEETRKQMVDNAFAELESVRRKYKNVTELDAIFSEIERLRKESA